MHAPLQNELYKYMCIYIYIRATSWLTREREVGRWERIVAITRRRSVEICQSWRDERFNGQADVDSFASNRRPRVECNVVCRSFVTELCSHEISIEPVAAVARHFCVRIFLWTATDFRRILPPRFEKFSLLCPASLSSTGGKKSHPLSFCARWRKKFNPSFRGSSLNARRVSRGTQLAILLFWLSSTDRAKTREPRTFRMRVRFENYKINWIDEKTIRKFCFANSTRFSVKMEVVFARSERDIDGTAYRLYGNTSTAIESFVAFSRDIVPWNLPDRKPDFIV